MFNRNHRFGRSGFNYGYGGGGYGRQQRIWPWILLIIIACILIIGLQKDGKLGHIKNQLFKTPTEQVATVDQGIAKVNQANKNLAHRDAYANGNLDQSNEGVKDNVLLKDQFENINDIGNFGKVYSVFVFSNSKADVPWLNEIVKARKDEMTVKTLDGRNITQQEDPLIYHYFNYNFDVPKDNENYGKLDGYYHPFMILFINGQEKQLITNPKDEKKLFENQYSIMKQVDKKANNYELPNPDVGIPYPDWSDMAKDAGNAIKNQASTVINHIKNSKNSNSNS